MCRVKSTGAGWTKLKLQSALPASVTATGKYSPAIGKYQTLDKTWKPVHKIRFLKPHGAVLAHSRNEDDQLFRVLITSMCVVDHPELQMAMGRKDSTVTGLAPPDPRGKKKDPVDFKGKGNRSRSSSGSGESSGKVR